MQAWVVSTCIPDRGEKPCYSSVVATETEAEAYADEMIRAERENAGITDRDNEENETPRPYPGDCARRSHQW